MTRLVHATFVLFLLCTIGACGDDAASNADASVAEGGTDSGGETAAGQCKGTFAAVNRTQLGALTKTTGKCAMPADLDIICGNDVGLTTRNCGSSCYSANPGGGEAALVMCTTTCVRMALNPDLTDDCLGCYAGAIACTLNMCLTECAADSTTPGCVQCQTAKGCLPTFFGCSGLPAPSAPPSDGGSDAGDGGAAD